MVASVEDRRSGGLEHRHPNRYRTSLRRCGCFVAGLLLTSYIVLFVVVVTRHLDATAEEELRRLAVKAAQDIGSGVQPIGWEPPLVGLASYGRRKSGTEGVRKHRTAKLCTWPKYRDSQGPVVALASFPGSGNTWVRHLVQQATGYLTGSVYKDLSLKRNGFPAEGTNDGSVVLVKTHEWGLPSRKNFHAAVLLIRDPYRCLLAEYHRRARGHIGHAPVERFTRGNAWPDFVALNSRLWMEMNLDWLKFEGPLYILQYELLQENLASELSRLLSFLNASVSWTAFKCALHNSEGLFRRAPKTYLIQPFNKAMEEAIDRYKEIVHQALSKYQKSLRSLHNANKTETTENTAQLNL